MPDTAERIGVIVTMGDEKIPEPPILYKYVPPERLDILVNKKIRLTQPTSTNDPFDLFPFVPPLDFGEVSRILGNPLDKEIAPVRATEANATQLSRDISTVLRDHFKSLGLISLSATSSSIPMWAHYADNHRGFVIGFSIPVEFLVGRIEYTNERPTYRIILDKEQLPRKDGSFIKVLLSKRCEWAYEKEWRLLVSMDGRKPSLTMNGDLIYLQDIDPSWIESVIIGIRASHLLRESFLRLRELPEYQHLRLQQAVIDERNT